MTVSRATANNSSRLPGLDLLRCLAAGLVFLQHSLSSCHYDTAIDFAGFRIGRIGTAIFFMLGGFLCARSSRRPSKWLQDRLAALLPAYWIIVAVGFGIALIVRNKEFDVWQVICQFAGVGYFTHGDRLINVATWFITPLLIFYGIATVLRFLNSGIANILTIAMFSVLAIRDFHGYETALCHGATFFTAFAISAAGSGSERRFVAAVMMFSMLCLLQPEFRYATLASSLLYPAMMFGRPVRFASAFTLLAYEWFLVHGIVITGASRLFSSPLVVMIVCVPVSLLGALMLKRMADGVSAAVVKRFSQRSAPVESARKDGMTETVKPLLSRVPALAGPHGASSKAASKAAATL